jgi:hypothetical protein
MIRPAPSHLWLLALAATVLTAGALRTAGLSLDLTGAGPLLLFGALAGGAAACRGRMKHPWRARAVDLAECWFLFTLFSMLGAVASYAVAATSTGYADAHLIAADRAVGLDWLATYRFVAARPALADLTTMAYQSIFVSPLLVLAGLVCSGRSERARTFVLAYALALAATLVLFHWFPARSVVPLLGPDPVHLPVTGLFQPVIIDALRTGTLRTVSLAELHGLISFPSFHAVAAILFAWAAWPLRPLGGPILVINLAMLAATPVEGAHYFVDLAGGGAVALLALAMVRRPKGRATRRPAPLPATA